MPPPRPWRSRIGGALRRLAAAIEQRPAERALGRRWLGTATEHGRALAADGAPEAWLARLREAGIVPPDARSGTVPEAADAEAPPSTAPGTPDPTDAAPPAPPIAAARDQRPPSIAAAPLRGWPTDAPVARLRLRLPAPRAARSSSLAERSQDARAMEPGSRPTERQPRRADPVDRPADAPPSRAPAPEPSRQRQADDGLRPPRARGSGHGGAAAAARGAREERGIREERGARRAEPRPSRPLRGERVPDPGVPLAVAPAAPPAVPHGQPPVDAVSSSERTPRTRPGPPAAVTDPATVAPRRTASGTERWSVPAPAALVPTHPIVSETARASSRAVAHPWPDLGAQAVEAAAAPTPADIARELVRVVRLEQEQSAV